MWDTHKHKWFVKEKWKRGLIDILKYPTSAFYQIYSKCLILGTYTARCIVVDIVYRNILSEGGGNFFYFFYWGVVVVVMVVVAAAEVVEVVVVIVVLEVVFRSSASDGRNSSV